MLDAMDEAYTNQVAKSFDAAGWTSFDGTSEFARMRVLNANKEFSDAVKEAKGIRAVLQDAYDELKKYKDDLVQLADVDAKKDGAIISPTGEMSLREPSEAGNERRGPGGMLPSENEAKLMFWEARINLRGRH